MKRRSWREQTSVVLNSNTIYCSTFFANRIKSTKFIISLWTKLSVQTYSRGDWSHTPRQAPPQPRIHFLLPQSPTSEFNFFHISRKAHPLSKMWRILAVTLVTRFFKCSRWKQFQIKIDQHENKNRLSLQNTSKQCKINAPKTTELGYNNTDALLRNEWASQDFHSITWQSLT
jgi:hypothetical protein